MHRRNADGDIVGREQGLQRDEHLLRETLLDLRPLREEGHDAIDLRQADDLVLGDVGHRGRAVDGRKVMLDSPAFVLGAGVAVPERRFEPASRQRRRARQSPLGAAPRFESGVLPGDVSVDPLFARVGVAFRF